MSKADCHKDHSLRSVSVPEALRPAFSQAENLVKEYFDRLNFSPEKASITVGDERYILVRGAALSTEFTEMVSALYMDRGEREAQNVARDLLFDLAHTLGKNDAKQFHATMGITDPVEKLSVGPVHFAYAGWAYVKVLPESRPAADETFFLSYEHPRSFEADAWIAGGKVPLHPVCIMNAGYSSGWCEESFGVGLVSVELECRALGHDNCRFVMAPPDKVEGIIRDIKGNDSEILTHSSIPQIPEFFQRKRLEEELKRERDFVSKILSTARVLICVLDSDGTIVQFNPACENATGYEASELLGTPIWETLILPEEREGVEAVFKNLTHDKCSNAYENFWVAKDGSRRLISWSNAPMLDSDGAVEHVIATGTDITEKELENQLLQAQKLESMGRLAAGVAHEINTPAQFVGDNNRFLSETMGDFTEILSTFNQLLFAVKNGGADDEMIAGIEKRLEEADLEYLLEEVPQALEQSSEGMDRIVEIVGAMKAFSHSGGSQKTHADINEIIKNAVTVSRHEWKYVAEMDVVLDEQVPPILCLPGELGQVILNMVVNAAHAIGENGEEDASKGLISIRSRYENESVIFAVEDNGPGVPEDLRSLVFEPFFTTKEVGKGTGQGLAISRTVVVEKHGGSISVDCPDGGGTIFTVVLPKEPA